MSAEGQGALLGNSTTGVSPRQRRRDPTIRGISGSGVFYAGRRQANSDATTEHVIPHHATPTTDELLEAVFSVGSVPGLYKELRVAERAPNIDETPNV
jgi:hypothetical protein